MKIVYFAGNRPGADTQLVRFLEHLDKRHEVKIAAYTKSSYSFKNIDWLLDPLYINPDFNTLKRRNHLLNLKMVPVCNYDALVGILSGIDSFSPDLIITDGERMAIFIAKSLDVEVWSCSPLNAIKGLSRKMERSSYYTSGFHDYERTIKSDLIANKNFMYSPLNLFNYGKPTKLGYEFITPYHYKIEGDTERLNHIVVLNDKDRIESLNDIYGATRLNINLFCNEFPKTLKPNINYYDINDKEKYLELLQNCKTLCTNGDTSFMSDSFYNGFKTIVSPSVNDYESLLNASYVRMLRLGNNIGQVEYMEKYAIEYLYKGYRIIPNVKYRKYFQREIYLHERVELLYHVPKRETLAQSISD